MIERIDQPALRPALRGAFTIAEAIVVVAVVGVVAVIGVPRLSSANPMTGDARLRRDLDELRRAVTVYAAQHDNTPPGVIDGGSSSRADGATVAAQLTGWTDRRGQSTATPNGVYRFGPYLRHVPVNAINGLDTFTIVSPGRRIDGATGGSGWLYQPSTLTVVPDVAGRDAQGVRYIDY